MKNQPHLILMMKANVDKQFDIFKNKHTWSLHRPGVNRRSDQGRHPGVFDVRLRGVLRGLPRAQLVVHPAPRRVRKEPLRYIRSHGSSKPTVRQGAPCEEERQGICDGFLMSCAPFGGRLSNSVNNEHTRKVINMMTLRLCDSSERCRISRIPLFSSMTCRCCRIRRPRAE